MLLTIITNGIQFLLIGFMGQVVNTHPEFTQRHKALLLWGFMGASLLVFGCAIYGAYRQQQDTADLIGNATGGDTFAYLMLYDFDIDGEISAKQTVIIKPGKYPLYSLQFRIADIDRMVQGVPAASNEFSRNIGEIDAPAVMLPVNWKLLPSLYWRIFFSARNGQWHQDLQLKKDVKGKFWAAATRVFDMKGKLLLEHVDNEFVKEFGEPQWRQ